MKSLVLLSVLAFCSAKSFVNQNYGNQVAPYNNQYYNNYNQGFGNNNYGDYQRSNFGQQRFTGAILSAINSFESYDRSNPNYRQGKRYFNQFQNYHHNCPEGQVAQYDGRCVTADVNHNYHLFAAPPQEKRTTPQVPLPKPQIRYNHVFVKTPEDENAQPIVIPPPEEKTLVYVLNKEQDEEQQVIQVPSRAHNPEVFYINYDDEDAGNYNGQDSSFQNYSGNNQEFYQQNYDNQYYDNQQQQQQQNYYNDQSQQYSSGVYNNYSGNYGQNQQYSQQYDNYQQQY